MDKYIVQKISNDELTGSFEENIDLMIEYANKILYIASNLKGKQKGLVYTNICKGCGKEINVARKNHYFCSLECKRKYTSARNKENYQKYKANMSEQEKEMRKQEATNRVRELRKMRKENKNG